MTLQKEMMGQHTVKNVHVPQKTGVVTVLQSILFYTELWNRNYHCWRKTQKDPSKCWGWIKCEARMRLSAVVP